MWDLSAGVVICCAVGVTPNRTDTRNPRWWRAGRRWDGSGHGMIFMALPNNIQRFPRARALALARRHGMRSNLAYRCFLLLLLAFPARMQLSTCKETVPVRSALELESAILKNCSLIMITRHIDLSTLEEGRLPNPEGVGDMAIWVRQRQFYFQLPHSLYYISWYR